jgi:hypothetical protein
VCGKCVRCNQGFVVIFINVELQCFTYKRAGIRMSGLIPMPLQWAINYHYKIKYFHRCHVILDSAELGTSTERRIQVKWHCIIQELSINGASACCVCASVGILFLLVRIYVVWFLYHISVKSPVRKQTRTHTHTHTQYGDLGYLRLHPYIFKGQKVAF